MLNPTSLDQGENRSGGERQRPVVPADSTERTAGMRGHGSPLPSLGSGDDPGKATSTDARQCRPVPIDRDALY